MRRAIYAGSFDPVTFGHVDVITRASALFDELIVGVAKNDSKQPLLSLEERAQLLRESVAAANVVVTTLEGLLVDFARRQGIFVIIRGLRAVSDFEFEFQMALTNRRLEPRLETVFLTPKEDCTFLSSRIVKEIARLGGDVSALVPPPVVARLKSKFTGK